MTIVNTISHGAFGLILLMGAGKIAQLIAPKEDSQPTSVMMSTDNLALISFSLAGIFYLVDGMRWFVNDFSLSLLTSHLDKYGSPNINSIAGTITAAFKILIGLLLLVGARGLISAIHWAWKIGRQPWGEVRDSNKTDGD